MDLEQLYEILDIEEPSEFMYFENFAELVEYSKPLDADIVYQLIGQLDMEVFSELIESYFDDVIGSVPGDENLVVEFLENMKAELMALCIDNDEDQHRLLRLTDKLISFKQWYSERESCNVEKNYEITMMTPRDAFIEARLARLGEDVVLDFSGTLELDE